MRLIFEKSSPGRYATAQAPIINDTEVNIPAELLREEAPILPETSELDVVRHYTQLSQKNFSINTQGYYLGSCTMKYNPDGVDYLASLEGFLGRHPLALEEKSQGYLSCVYELQETLKHVTGMKAVSLAPMAGAQGEYAGVAMIRAYHDDRGDDARCEIIVPDAAHGTNPASAVMCGYKVKELPTKSDGDVDLEALKKLVGPQTAGIMLTNPSTLGVFERQIKQVADLVHQVGGLLYYDGANLNAILSKVRPGDMGFDVMHMNLHKTFATPHGGGGPGCGPVAVGDRLLPYLPIPMVDYDGEHYFWLSEKAQPKSIGRMSAFMGNAGIILRAYIYCCILGREGLRRVAEFATLNANYLMKRLEQVGFTLAFPERRATHEFIVTLKNEAKNKNITAMDIAKRLLDFGFHAPTTYFPLCVPECLLIEPTETESKQELDGFIEAMAAILQEADSNPDKLRAAPYTLPARRLDDVKAAKELDLAFKNHREA